MKKSHSIFIGLLIASIISIPMFFSSSSVKQDNSPTQKSVKAATNTQVRITATPSATLTPPTTTPTTKPVSATHSATQSSIYIPAPTNTPTISQ